MPHNVKAFLKMLREEIQTLSQGDLQTTSHKRFIVMEIYVSMWVQCFRCLPHIFRLISLNQCNIPSDGNWRLLLGAFSYMNDGTDWVSIKLSFVKILRLSLSSTSSGILPAHVYLFYPATMNATYSQLPNQFTPLAFLPTAMAEVKTNQVYASIGSLAVSPTICLQLNEHESFYRVWFGILVCISLRMPPNINC